MNEADFGSWDDNNFVAKLKRGINEAPLELDKMNPLRLVHNRLARMVQHDVSFGAKVKPE